MQITLDNVSFKNLKNVSFNIEKNKINGLVCNDIKDLINKGYLVLEKEHLKVNKDYFYVLNDILVNFV